MRVIQPLKPASVIAALWLGSLGLLILGIQPVVLEPLVRFGRIGESALGSIATVEILAIAAGSVLGTRLLRSRGASAVALIGLLPFVAANLAVHWLRGPGPLLAIRGASGLAAGVLVGLAVVAIARGKRPERLSAAFLVTQTLLQLVVAAVVPAITRFLLPEDLGFVALAVLGASSLPVVLLLPPRLEPPATQGAGGGRAGAAAWIALAGCGTYLVGIVAVWAYFGVWEHQLGAPDAAIGMMTALSLAAQVAGAAAGGWLGPSLPSRSTLLGTGLSSGLVVVALLHASGGAAQAALAAAFGFLWLFALPLQTKLLVELDPPRRVVLHLAAAQLGGSAAGPTLAGFFVTAGRVEGALWTGVALLATAALIMGIGPRPR